MSKKEQRFARFDIRPLEKPQKLDNGFLRAPVFATRSGVFKYVQSDGTVVREFRPPEQVFSADSLETLSGVPFTNRHPVELVDSKNAKKYMVGFTADTVEKHGNFVKTMVTITDQDMIDEIEKGGLREVSCGYTCDLEFKAGRTDEGEEYDAIQTNIQYNHLAGVDRGRAGPDVRLKMDSKSAILDDENENNKPFNGANSKKGDAMAKITLNGAEHEVESGLATAINAALKDAKKAGAKEVEDQMKKKKSDAEEALQAKIDEQTAKIDTLEAENKKLEESKMDTKQIHEAAQKRAELVETAKLALDEDKITAEMTDLEIKAAVIVEKTSMDADDEKLKSEAYVEARFDGVVETLKEEKNDNNKDLKKALGKNAGKQDSDDEPDYEAKRKESMKQDSEAWKKPTGFHLAQ